MTFETASDPAWGPILSAALAARRRAYVPYSGYPVGAAFACADGTIVSGCNVENASYGATICAERSAISAAVLHGRPNVAAPGEPVRAGIDLVAGVVVTAGPIPAPPCGMCRQVISEFAADLPILLIALPVGDAAESGVSALGHRVRVALVDIFPGAFGPDHLRRRTPS